MPLSQASFTRDAMTPQIPTELEYLILDVFLALLTASLFPGHLRLLLRSRPFWYGFPLFFLFATGVESIALAMGWWEFVPHKILGLSLISIPLEEYLMFFLFYTFVLCVWRHVTDDLA